MSKRTIDAFFARKAEPESKKQRTEAPEPSSESSHHETYPFPIPHLPPKIDQIMSSLPARVGKEINDQPDLDLLYFEPYMPSSTAKDLFEFLRSQLPFYRVEYDIKRGGFSTHIRTPRYTTVFGIDETSKFDESGAIIDSKTGTQIPTSGPKNPYPRYAPRPIPRCLDQLRVSAEAATGCHFNFCLVNYYASGADSISPHSDDERFLGPEPAIASFSLGARRDFVLKHKPMASPAAAEQGIDGAVPQAPGLKLPLGSGDMILMRGRTQSNWLHSIPKRTGKNAHDGGRINITFRRAMVKGGTGNYYNYNVGTGPVLKWDNGKREMVVWKP